MHILSNCIISPQVKNSKTHFLTTKGERNHYVLWVPRRTGLHSSHTDWREMEFSAPGERIMTTLNRCDPRCSAPLRASPHHWPLEACNSHWGQREGEEAPAPSVWKPCPGFQHQQVNERQGAAWAPLSFLLISHFRLLICVVLLEVCQAGPELEARCGHHTQMYPCQRHLPPSYFSFALVRDAQLVPYSLALLRQLWWTASVMPCHEPYKIFSGVKTQGTSRSFIRFAQISLL